LLNGYFVKMNPEQLQSALANLRGIHEPAAVSWWPLAIGWWVLIALSVLLVGYLTLKWVRHRRVNHYRTVAKIGLQLSYEQWQDSADSHHYLQSANALLKRSIRHINQELNLASTTGENWAALLNHHAKTALPESAIIALTQECYQPKPQTDIAALHQQLLEWFKSHTQKPKSKININGAANA